MDTPRSNRRLFRFSLRTALVALTALCVWMGYTANIVHQRKAMLLWMDQQKWAYLRQPSTAPSTLSWHRRAMGDVELDMVIPNQATPAQQQQMRETFPEARILHW